MSELTPADVITLHRYRTQDHCTIDGNAYCWCGWSTPIIGTHKSALELHATPLLDALRANGFAVVELPREHEDDEPWPEFWGPWTTYAVTPNGLVRTDEGVPWMKPDDARAEAAALLAAADAADRAGDDGEGR